MGWDKLISTFLSSETGTKLKKFVSDERNTKRIYPEPKDVFTVFKEDLLKFEDIKIVILGQDPYPSDHAHGIAFSSKQNKIPNSLKFIFQELKRDLYSYLKQDTFDKYFASPDLTSWVKQGIFMYNTILTVEEGKIGSHADKGWEVLTELVIKKLNNHPKPLVFMLWGSYAKNFKSQITNKKHLVLEAPHPNAQQYNKDAGFIGCSHFSQALDFIEKHRIDELTKIRPNISKLLDKTQISNEFMNMFKKHVPPMPIKYHPKQSDLLAEMFIEQVKKEVYWTNAIDFRTSITQ